MLITKTVIDDTVHISLSGRLDTITSVELSSELGIIFEEESKNLVFNLLNLEYISSAGLRVFLTAQKKVTAAGAEMKITGANESVKEVFDITGFSGIMTIE